MSSCGNERNACCATRKQEQSCNGAITIKKTPQSLLFDALGPYPDEIIMTVLDRLLYYSGATQIKHFLEMAAIAKTVSGGEVDVLAAAAALTGGSASTPALNRTASCSSFTKGSSNCSLASILCPTPKSSCSSNRPLYTPNTSCNKSKTATAPVCTSKTTCLKPSTSCRNSSPTSQKATQPSRKFSGTWFKPSPTCYSRLSGASSCPRQRSPRVDFANAVSEPGTRQSGMRQIAGGLSMSDRIKLSLSMCSMTCRNLKNKFTCPCNRCSTKETDRNKWLWTRLVNCKDGYKIYEVYKDSNVKQDPCILDGSQEPIILFLVMPNGYIMPFESLSF